MLGKIAVKLAPPEPQLQHAALRLTARGWETAPLPAPGGATGSLVVALDLHAHDAVAELSSGRQARIPLTPHRPVGTVTRELLAAIADLAGPVPIDPTPQEVTWTVPLDEDDEHARYDTTQVETYFKAATAMESADPAPAYRAPYRGRSTPVNAWWGSFDLAVSLFSGDAKPSRRPQDFIMRNAMDIPGSRRSAGGQVTTGTREAAFYAYAHPAPDHFSQGRRWPGQPRTGTPPSGEFIPAVGRGHSGPGTRIEFGLDFARSAFQPRVPGLRLGSQSWPATIEGNPPPVK